MRADLRTSHRDLASGGIEKNIILRVIDRLFREAWRMSPGQGTEET
jgi:hypothetical protein